MVYLNEHIEDIDVSDALRRVSPERAAYALRYRQPIDQRLSLAVYMLLMQGLEREYGITDAPRFVFGPHGKPSLDGHPGIHFSLSHCRQAALCVIDNVPVGCDVESVPDGLDMDVCRHCFNEEEMACITGADQPTLAFAQLWTRKEAFLKLTGTGLTSELPSLLCSPAARRAHFETTIASSGAYVYTVCK